MSESLQFDAQATAPERRRDVDLHRLMMIQQEINKLLTEVIAMAAVEAAREDEKQVGLILD